MSKTLKIFIFAIIGIVGLLTYLEAEEPEPINWFPSYSKADKIPLGTYVAYNLIKEAFDEYDLKDINQPPYEFLSDNDTINGTYMFINGSIGFDKSELDKILTWVEKGNTLFVSAKNIESALLDTLNIDTDRLVSLDDINTKPLVELTNNTLKSETPFLYDRNVDNLYFSEIDTANMTVLGTTQLYQDTLQIKEANINYLETAFGNGKILLHTFPEAFGNYFMLKDNHYTYTQNLLAYINPTEKILWDRYYKSGKTFYTSPLYLLLNNRYLKWAYYFILIGTVLFVLFEGKRKQRSIPIVEPLKNQTLSFTKTISGMYYQKEKHKEIATKQNLLFLEYIRNTLRISFDHIDDKVIRNIAARSNNSIEDTKTLFRYFDTIHQKSSINKDELTHLYTLITTFKNQSKKDIKVL